MSNPLLEPHELPPFSRIRPEHVEPAISQLIARNRRAIDDLLAARDHYTWDDLPAKIESMDDELARAWSPVGHLNGVLNSDELRAAYNACLPKLAEYSTWVGQHSALCAAYQQIADSEEFASLSEAQRKTIEHALRDFRLAGVSLPTTEKQRFGELRRRLSELGSRFSENVLDATHAWKRPCSVEELSGLPDSALELAAHAAAEAGLDGYLVTLDFPSLQPVLSYCDNRALREEVYQANVTRASELGPNAGEFDNSDILCEILALRREMASLLGYANYAELSLATKMADSTDAVLEFLQHLASRCAPQAREEWRELQAFAAADGVAELQAWDVGYYSEKLRQQKFRVSQEQIRPYLPLPRVLEGLFEVCGRLFGISFREVKDFDRYHADVRLFEVLRGDDVIARFYLDLYARARKRGGAWMDDCRIRRATADGLQIPVAYLVCNFSPPVGDKPALLTDSELTTLFHEFGHGLHHMLTQQSVAAVSGINGVAWDAVELPSQFLENWCWEEQALAFISGHYQSGEVLPGELLQNMLAAKNFQSAMHTVRQLEFALFDFRLHMAPDITTPEQVQGLLDAVRSEVAVVIPPPFNRFQNSFSHIFAGGYAAGYFSYKWAEVLSADAFARFEEEGIFNPQTGREFLHAILEVGGSRDAMAAFVEFRGREPDVEPLLRHSGIAA